MSTALIEQYALAGEKLSQAIRGLTPDDLRKAAGGREDREVVDS